MESGIYQGLAIALPVWLAVYLTNRVWLWYKGLFS